MNWHENYFLWCIPVISGFIGWITNYIAVKMIFRPRKKIHIFGYKFIGLIPKRKSDLARKIGETIEKELISHQDIHSVVNTPAFHEHLLDSVMDAIDRFITQKLGSRAFVTQLLTGDFVMQIKEMIKNELRTMLPAFMESMFEKMEEKIDLKEIVRKKIEGFDLIKLEQIIYGIASRELKAIELWGGVLGFLVGIIQVFLILI